MKRICTLTDRKVLGRGGYSLAKPRLTARAILKDREGRFAVMYSERNRFYSLPGGGIEADETAVQALRRELMEETGCRCTAVAGLGIVEENRAHCNFTQRSFYYVAETDGPCEAPHLTPKERENRTEVVWLSWEEAYRCITDAVHGTKQRKFIQARDKAALDAYRQRWRGETKTESETAGSL